jgi:hypothetical protein
MSDYYRDRVRQGGILSNQFIKFVSACLAGFCYLLTLIASRSSRSQWWDRQVVSMQYGNPNKAVRTWGKPARALTALPCSLPDPGLSAGPNAPLGAAHGPACLEGKLSAEELVANRNDQTIDTRQHHYLDEPYFKSKDYNLADIEVPVLSIANLGGITLHLRGNVVGYMEAGSKNKWLWFISGR